MLMIRRITIWLSLMGLGLTGCSSTSDKVEPAELQKFEPTIELTRLWRENVGGYDGKFLTFAPVISGDRIFAMDYEGDVIALEKSSGDELWEQELDSETSGGLGADSRHVYLGLFDGRVLALSQEDGSSVWEARVSSEILVPPQSNGLLVAIQTTDGRLFGLDARTGEQRWVFTSAQPALTLRGTATPFITPELTYAGFANGDVVAIENATGSVVWQRKVGVPTGRTELERLVDIDGGFVLDDGVLYTVGYQGKVVALDALSGQEIWSKPASSMRAPATGYTNLYYVSANGEVVALSKSAQSVAWTQEGLRNRDLSAPATYRDTVVVGDFEGYVHFLSQVDGSFQARIRPDSDGVRAQPVVEDGVIYILGNDGKLSAWRVLESN